jgi:hypothetical protein
VRLRGGSDAEERGRGEKGSVAVPVRVQNPVRMGMCLGVPVAALALCLAESGNGTAPATHLSGHETAPRDASFRCRRATCTASHPACPGPGPTCIVSWAHAVHLTTSVAAFFTGVVFAGRYHGLSREYYDDQRTSCVVKVCRYNVLRSLLESL